MDKINAFRRAIASYYNYGLVSRTTRKFEGANYGTLQTADSGVLSYGDQQATLRSGALQNVVREYVKHSKSRAAETLKRYIALLSPTAKKDEQLALRKDESLLSALKNAGQDPAMILAQEKVFYRDYYKSSSRLAAKNNIKTLLGQAIFYDTNVHGGLKHILAQTKARVDDVVNEKEFLQIFLDERQRWIWESATNHAKIGDDKSANMLKNSDKRVSYFRDLLDKGDFSLKSE